MLRNKRLKRKFLRGDSLVEVMFSVGIFGIVAVSAISLMNRGVNSAQTSLETTMARNEIDAQAEALRFIHDAYAAGKNNETNEYENLWNNITNLAVPASDIYDSASATATYSGFLKYPSEITSCEYDGSGTSAYYDDSGIGGMAIINGKSFVINTHALNASTDPNLVFITNTSSSIRLKSADTYARLVFNDGIDFGSTALESTFNSAQGIWVTAVKPTATGTNPQYYDFYIRTCWNSPGRGTPLTISTIIRLYNPDI